jgi:hypothetical protein
VPATGAFVVDTCSDGLREKGDDTHWSWANPTSIVIAHYYEDIAVVASGVSRLSVEAQASWLRCVARQRVRVKDTAKTLASLTQRPASPNPENKTV